MAIQWYPGHMHKAQKEMRQVLPKVDVIIEILDARIPFSSENPMLAQIRSNKPCLKVLAKSDLADSTQLAVWQEYLERERHIKTLAISTLNPEKMHQVPLLCAKLAPEKSRSIKNVRAMIAGIPNVGKSTLINILAGRVIAKTGNEPAVTKTQQTIHLDDGGLTLLDTPGILWPKQELEDSSYRLAITGAIKDTAMDYDDIAFFAARYLMKAYPHVLLKRYELDELPEGELEFFEIIGRRRGCLSRGGRVDLVKISELFIGDIRTGRFGTLCWETPEMIVEEKARLEQQKVEKKERDERRKTKR
ncbi:MAG: ribosome biogenesis GTPase YlqF [Alteromonadaceae bacterium]|nr:MAG: ribosome biogenesis GTPase YlqF [Alteromonadaceae bacterium]